MQNPRPEKVAVVNELKQRFAESEGTILTEYRGLDVAAMAELRNALRAVGGEYKIYKNTLVRLAARDCELELEALLVGPTALAFVSQRADGCAGDVAAVAKALRDFAKNNAELVIKGGVLNDQTLTSEHVKALATLPPREVLLAQLAGAFAAPTTKFARLLAALPQNFAYALNALIKKQQSTQATSTQATSNQTQSNQTEEA